MSVRGRREGDLEPGRHPTFSRSYLYANAIEFWMGVAAVFSGVVYLVRPDVLLEAPIGRAAGPLGLAWNLLYVFGGAGIVGGVLTAARNGAWRWELAGLYLLVAAIAANGVAVAVERGTTGIGTVCVYVALAVAFGMRARAIVRLTGAVLIVTERGGRE